MTGMLTEHSASAGDFTEAPGATGADAATAHSAHSGSPEHPTGAVPGPSTVAGAGTSPGAAPRAAETTVCTDDGARLAVSVLAPLAPASGTTVVLAHGWAAARRVWGGVADRLIRRGHRVVAADLRGHGASTPGGAPFSVPRLGADLAAVLEHTGARDAVLVGHSGGGFAALSYATDEASAPAARALRGLVLLGTAAHDQDTPDSEVRMMGSALFSRALARPALGRRLLAQTMGKGVDRRALEVNRQMFAATSPRVRADAFRSSRGMDLRAALAAVHIPAVVLAGDGDRVIAPHLAHAVAEALPRARFTRLPGAGHMLPLERPDEIVSAVESVLGDGTVAAVDEDARPAGSTASAASAVSDAHPATVTTAASSTSSASG